MMEMQTSCQKLSYFLFSLCFFFFSFFNTHKTQHTYAHTHTHIIN